ncbi:MAG TPA: hypothetical protein VMS71_03890 [Candidatus Acidoferrum sp.]|nr:hypothetical protein [Candidatus Acidoferrum sp.]
MTISQDMIIDVALNVAGYLAAAGLLLIIGSLFRRTPKRAKATAPVTESVAQDTLSRTERTTERRRLEFVNLKSDTARPEDQSRPVQKAGREDIGAYRRNRVEVMRLAREMLEAGSTRERVRETLPISEGELALLTRE